MYDLRHESQHRTASLVGRWDIYGPIHKGLRQAHAAMISRLATADWSGPETAPLLGELRAHLRLAAKHLSHEETHIHAALEARSPGDAAAIDDQHDHHRARFAVLEGQIAALEAGFRSDRPELGRALYLGFTEMVAEDLAHMLHEERVVWPRLCELFSDEELKGLEMEIVGSLAPDDVIAFMRLMIPAISRPERVALLTGMKADAPAEAFAAVLQHAARPTLPAAEWEHLELAGLAA